MMGSWRETDRSGSAVGAAVSALVYGLVTHLNCISCGIVWCSDGFQVRLGYREQLNRIKVNQSESNLLNAGESVADFRVVIDRCLHLEKAADAPAESVAGGARGLPRSSHGKISRSCRDATLDQTSTGGATAG